MTSPLDRMIDAVRTSEARLDDAARAAILDRLLAGDAEPRFVAAAMPAIASPSAWPRRLALGAIGLALAAAIVVAIVKLGPGPGDRAIAEAMDVPPAVTRDDVVRPGATVKVAPVWIVPSVLESLRLSGERDLFPDDATQRALAKAGKDRLVATVAVCLGTDGHVTDVTISKSSGAPAYDRRLMMGVRDWDFRPYVVDGVARRVCARVGFVYQQR